MTQYYTTLWLAKGKENKTERKQVRISADWRQSIKLFTSMSEKLNSGLPFHVKETVTLFVSLRGRKCRFWTFLQFSGWRANPIIHSYQLSFRFVHKEICHHMEVPILQRGAGLDCYQKRPKTTPACGLREICSRGERVEIQRLA